MVTISCYTPLCYHRHLILLHIAIPDAISQVYLGPGIGRLPGITFLLHNGTNQENKVSLA